MILTLKDPFTNTQGFLQAYTTSSLLVQIGRAYGMAVLYVGGMPIVSEQTSPLTTHEEAVTWASKQGVQILVAPGE